MSDAYCLKARDGRTFKAFVAAPERPNGAGIVLLPEVYNVNSWARGVASSYAARGHTVLVPDLFWRQGPGQHLDYDQPERARANGEAVDIDAVVGDVGVAAGALRNQLGAAARVGVIGFCLGGRLALLAAIREPVDAAISYYGVKLEQHLDELAGLAVPSILHFGETDPWVPPSTLEAVRQLYDGREDVAVHVYANAGHGFARNGYPPFRADAAALAAQRGSAMLEQTLLGPR
ncbi:MAG: putative carboxymethylenebutenolidase [Rubritepida sp.]|nr:putative carboxymethylenebutenolidase [Rubritepida sp.]